MDAALTGSCPGLRGSEPDIQARVAVGPVFFRLGSELAAVKWAMLLGVKVKSRFTLLGARKPYAEEVGHTRKGWCAWVWSPPPPGLSKEPGER